MNRPSVSPAAVLMKRCLLPPLAAIFLQVAGSSRAAPPVFLQEWGSEGPGPSQFLEPSRIAVDAAGVVYVLDPGLGRIQRFTADGGYLSEWPSGGTEGANVFAWIPRFGTVVRFSPDGIFERHWSAAGMEQIAPGPPPNLYGVFSEDHLIRLMTSEGGVLTEWGTFGPGPGEFDSPADVAADGAGNVYVVDRGNHRIQKFSRPTSVRTESFGRIKGRYRGR